MRRMRWLSFRMSKAGFGKIWRLPSPCFGEGVPCLEVFWGFRMCDGMIGPAACSYCGGEYGEHDPCCPKAFKGIPPTFCSVDQEILRRALEAIELGLEHTRTSLAEYDDTHGRAILRHRQWCETLEQHAGKLLRSREELMTSLGFEKSSGG